MIISILTLFPEVFKEIFSSSIIARAQKNNLVKINVINIRDFALDRHKTVDDRPYGGGEGMIMKVDVLDKSIINVKCPLNKNPNRKIPKSVCKEKVILLDPAGKLYNQSLARKFSKFDHLILICGHYEGVDARVNNLVDESISIGEYILTGGEIPAMVIIDSVIRLLPGVLGNPQGAIFESFSKENIVEAPQYTRPREYKGLKVPKVLYSGNHDKILKWKEEKSKKRSNKRKKYRK